MAYDNTGATVGAAGHDAAELVAAFISAGIIATEEDAFASFVSLRDQILANSLEVQAATAPATSAPSGRRSSAPRSSGGGNSGGPAGADTEIRSGKYTGRKVSEVIEEDLDYAEWAAANMKNDFLRKAFATALESV